MRTDIEKLKEIAKLLLEVPITPGLREFHFFIQHPIFKERLVAKQVPKTEKNPVGIEMIDISIPENLQEVKEMYRGLIDRLKRAIDFFLVINKPYLGLFFKLVWTYLSKEDYTELLEHLWTSMEYPNADKNVSKEEWISFWKQANLDLIYSDEDKKLLDSLPDEFPVYRGLMQKAKKQALSWTLDKDRAIWFAKRFGTHGKLYEATCNKKDILAYLSSRNESEIVVDWRKLKNIKEVEYE